MIKVEKNNDILEVQFQGSESEIKNEISSAVAHYTNVIFRENFNNLEQNEENLKASILDAVNESIERYRDGIAMFTANLVDSVPEQNRAALALCLMNIFREDDENGEGE